MSHATSGRIPRPAPLTLTLALTLALGAALSACTITPGFKPSASTPVTRGPTYTQYRTAVAESIQQRNPSRISHGLQAMLRSVVVVSFVVDRNGRVVSSSIYRTNGDPEAEHIALATLREAAPLPTTPARLLNGRGQVELMEDWLFNDSGQFQLRTLATSQAQDF